MSDSEQSHKSTFSVASTENGTSRHADIIDINQVTVCISK